MNTIKELFRDWNGGLVHLKTEHCELRANVSQTGGTPGPDVHRLNQMEVDILFVTYEGTAYLKVLESSLVLYSQRDPRWRNEVYAGSLTFGQAGCYVTCVAMIASLAGYDDDPPEVARKLREAGIFSGALLARPDKIPEIYPRLRYDGTLRWHKVPADVEQFRRELAKGPTIVEVDFTPGGNLNQHFVVAERFTANDDLVIVDPWDGARTKLLERYAKDNWNLARALYGMRLLHIEET